MTKPVVISFFDYTAIAVKDWAEAGYEVHCFDLQHEGHRVAYVSNGGTIHYRHADLSGTSPDWVRIFAEFADRNVVMVFGWPPCTDLAVSGARHFEAKRKADPFFQQKAVQMARMVETTANALRAPFVVENPVSVLATLWRKPDVVFSPNEYGGYLPENDRHPVWPQYIAPRDAYTKRTCYWTGNGFRMPQKRPVEAIRYSCVKADGTVTTGSAQWAKLGGKSLRTKNIRNATPRGIARAIFEENALPIDTALAA